MASTANPLVSYLGDGIYTHKNNNIDLCTGSASGWESLLEEKMIDS